MTELQKEVEKVIDQFSMLTDFVILQSAKVGRAEDGLNVATNFKNEITKTFTTLYEFLQELDT